MKLRLYPFDVTYQYGRIFPVKKTEVVWARSKASLVYGLRKIPYEIVSIEKNKTF